MVTKIEAIDRSDIRPDEFLGGSPRIYRLANGANGLGLEEIGYEISNVDGVATIIKPIFPPPAEGKFPKGSKPIFFENKVVELEGIMLKGIETPVTLRITDTTTHGISS